MGRARFVVSRELLQRALHMPETSGIFNIRIDDRNPDLIVIAAEDPSLPTGSTHEANPTVTAHHGSTEWDTTYEWRWNAR